MDTTLSREKATRGKAGRRLKSRGKETERHLKDDLRGAATEAMSCVGHIDVLTKGDPSIIADVIFLLFAGGACLGF